ncbi:MAG: protein DA1 [Lentisphaeria bacterium]|nr:protein DA1 [Lentisphaeria bacterium]
MKYRILLLFLLMPFLLAALECSQCGKKIRGNYVKTDNASYCSRKCFRKTLPVCARCGKACEKGYLTMMKKKFCSKRCLEQTFRCAVCRKGMESTVILTLPTGEQVMVCRPCSQGPKCYFCALPNGGGVLPDGRNICGRCRSSAVTDPQEVQRIFRQVRGNLARWFGFDHRHRIQLKIVDYPELRKAAKNIYMPGGGRQLALMQYNQEVTTRTYSDGRRENFVSKESCRIYVLKSTPELMLRDALAHELTHDHLRHKVGKVNDLASEEGFCELVASLYNIKTNNSKLNKAKEVNPDPVYGGGYRKMRSIYEKKRSLRETMKAVR